MDSPFHFDSHALRCHQTPSSAVRPPTRQDIFRGSNLRCRCTIHHRELNALSLAPAAANRQRAWFGNNYVDEVSTPGQSVRSPWSRRREANLEHGAQRSGCHQDSRGTPNSRALDLAERFGQCFQIIGQHDVVDLDVRGVMIPALPRSQIPQRSQSTTRHAHPAPYVASLQCGDEPAFRPHPCGDSPR